MKTRAIWKPALSVFIILGFSMMILAGETGKKEMIEYEVLSIDQQNWIVTAREIGTENQVSFRLPPEIFKGQTFDADFAKDKLGQRFSIRGSQNARLNNLIMERPIFRDKGKFMRARTVDETAPQPVAALGWEIENVDGKNWIVTSRRRSSNQVVQLQVHPDSFIGFRFKADLRLIQKGQGFTIVTPNELPMKNCCTLMKLMDEEKK